MTFQWHGVEILEHKDGSATVLVKTTDEPIHIELAAHVWEDLAYAVLQKREFSRHSHPKVTKRRATV